MSHSKCCKGCEKTFPAFEPHYPVVTLGECVRWDTVCKADKEYEVLPDSNVDTLREFVIDSDGHIAWCSDCHGETIVCMESVCQLRDALDNHRSILRGGKLPV